MVRIHPDPPFPGAVAQLGERLLCKQEVVGSIPSSSTKTGSRGQGSEQRFRLYRLHDSTQNWAREASPVLRAVFVL